MWYIVLLRCRRTESCPCVAGWPCRMRARLAGKKGLGLVARDITCRMGQADYILFVAHVAAATYSGVRLV